MTVGVLGYGRMGAAFAGALDAVSCPVLIAGACQGSAARVASRLRHACATDVPHLIRTASLLVLALPFAAALELMSGPPARAGAGRTLVDPTNPVLGPGPRPEAIVGRSGGEVLAASLTSWHVVKAFNSVPAAMMGTPSVPGGAVTLPIASDHEPAKTEVGMLARRLGFEPVDAGGIGRSRELEALAVLLNAINHHHGLAGRVGFHLARACPEPAQPRMEATCLSTSDDRLRAPGWLRG